MTKVRKYTDKQLLDKVKELQSYENIPENYWILGVQSNEDAYNQFDDKFYLFKGTKFILVTSGTTNSGASGIMNYDKYKKNGVAVVKTNEWYYNIWKYGYHNNIMPALKQVKPIKFYRDSNKNIKIEENGELYNDIIGINFHTVSYSKILSLVRYFIDSWSQGCQVINSLKDYYNILSLVKKQDYVTYCLIKEF